MSLAANPPRAPSPALSPSIPVRCIPYGFSNPINPKSLRDVTKRFKLAIPFDSYACGNHTPWGGLACYETS